MCRFVISRMSAIAMNAIVGFSLRKLMSCIKAEDRSNSKKGRVIITCRRKIRQRTDQQFFICRDAMSVIAYRILCGSSKRA